MVRVLKDYTANTRHDAETLTELIGATCGHVVQRQGQFVTTSYK